MSGGQAGGTHPLQEFENPVAPIRVGFVDHALQLGGAQKSLLELIAHLDRDRFEPVVVCSRGASWLDRPELRGVELAPVLQPTPLLERRRDDLGRSALADLRDALAGARLAAGLRRELIALRVDLVHSNTLKAHLLASVAARRARLPLIWHVRDILQGRAARGWLLRAGRLARPRVIAISEAVAAQFTGAGLDITLIHNGVPLDRFTPGPPAEDLRRRLGLSPEDDVLCIVGRLTPWKGHLTLLEAVAAVAARRPRVRLVVGGEVAFWERAYEDELRAHADRLGIADRVLWLGFRDDVPDILRLCDVFVLPSVDEPFGRAIIEAMAVARPVVATRSGGVPEIVAEGETGLLVAPGDASGLADALLALLSDPGRARLMGERGMARARECFDVRRVARQVQELWAGVLDR